MKGEFLDAPMPEAKGLDYRLKAKSIREGESTRRLSKSSLFLASAMRRRYARSTHKVSVPCVLRSVCRNKRMSSQR